jgi:DNA-binding MarR family transcriptional regulator
MRKVSGTAGAASPRNSASSTQDPPAVTARFGSTPAMDAVLGETVALFHRLRDASQQVHGQGELSSGRWGVLRNLDRSGPQTVPQMARSRPVSRQYIQFLVDGLTKQRLVELVENPAHKRSPLIQVTTKGKTVLEEMNRRATEVFQKLPVTLPERDLRRTASVLRTIRQLFEGKKWEQALKSIKP